MPKIKVKGPTVQTGERPQTNKRTHTDGRYQTYYRPCYAVDKNVTTSDTRRLSQEAYSFDRRLFVCCSKYLRAYSTNQDVSTNGKQEGLAVASIARDNSSTLPGERRQRLCI